MIAWSPIYHRIIIILERIKSWYCCKLNVHTAVYSQMVRLLSIQYSRSKTIALWGNVQYIPRNMHTVFAVLCCDYTLTDFPISIRLTSLALWQSNDCPSASKATLMNMDKYLRWIHYERLHNHNKAKHNKTLCIFPGIYCIWQLGNYLWSTWVDCLHAMCKGNERRRAHSSTCKETNYTHTHTHTYIYIYIYID